MAMQTHSMTQSACMRGSPLLPARCIQQRRTSARPSIVAMSTRKVNTVDDKWKKVSDPPPRVSHARFMVAGLITRG